MDTVYKVFKKKDSVATVLASIDEQADTFMYKAIVFIVDSKTKKLKQNIMVPPTTNLIEIFDECQELLMQA